MLWYETNELTKSMSCGWMLLQEPWLWSTLRALSGISSGLVSELSSSIVLDVMVEQNRQRCLDCFTEMWGLSKNISAYS